VKTSNGRIGAGKRLRLCNVNASYGLAIRSLSSSVGSGGIL
jgi:hypothetical protein